MTLRAAPLTRWSRLMRALSLGFFATLLIAFLAVQIQQRLFRHRAERLLADFQSIRLHQTTWAEAQTIMQRWGAWGRPEGPCTQTDCKYNIVVGDAYWRLAHRWQGQTVDWLFLHSLPLYSFLGGRIGDMQFTFNVQDGTVWRDGIFISLLVLPGEHPSGGLNGDYTGSYSLLLNAVATDRLRQQVGGHWILGTDGQLAEHPDFKIGRPSGCTNCISRTFDFTPYLPQTQLNLLTAYDLSCLTRRHPCLEPQDLLPLYRYLEPPYQEPTAPPPPQPCRIPIYARARDADAIIAIDALTAKLNSNPADQIQKLQEVATVKVNEILKGAPPMQPGQTVTLAPWTTNINYPEQASEHLVPGRRFLVFLTSVTPGSPLESDFCGVVEDTPENRAEVVRGVAQNDTFRRDEPFSGRIW